MYPPLRIRDLTEEELRVIAKLTRSQTASIRLVQRARIIQAASQGKTIAQISAELALNANVVRKWFKRFQDLRLLPPV